MKKVISNFSDSILTKNELSQIVGGNMFGCSTQICMDANSKEWGCSPSGTSCSCDSGNSNNVCG